MCKLAKMSPNYFDDWRIAVHDITAAYNHPSHVELEGLCEALRAMTVAHPGRDAVFGHADLSRVDYRRWLVAEGDRFSAILIGWPPGHASSIHDHDGLWGIELVLRGTLEVDEFEVDGDAARRTGHIELPAGQGTVFDRAGYAHACSNPSTTEPTLSLHVYGGPLVQYTAYPDETAVGERPRRVTTTLTRS
jgi:hypothetical protein